MSYLGPSRSIQIGHVTQEQKHFVLFSRISQYIAIRLLHGRAACLFGRQDHPRPTLDDAGKAELPLRCKDAGHHGSKSYAQPDDVVPKPIENICDAASGPNEQFAHDDITSPHPPADGDSHTAGDGSEWRSTNQFITSPKLCTAVPPSRQTRPPALTPDKAAQIVRKRQETEKYLKEADKDRIQLRKDVKAVAAQERAR
ncbi:hypothetical protein NM208_g13914 [Fusarium decemcellulare]|uniref:Uncharacterized protein n=1 Tax=Fusarium decemcellulare TaxID=57161 RepID=A0ACC1RJY0_9HYPO|nr:hypothetical protein NM208_g13914 [Fusarium decemcellulare]